MATAMVSKAATPNPLDISSSSSESVGQGLASLYGGTKARTNAWIKAERLIRTSSSADPIAPGLVPLRLVCFASGRNSQELR
jgi:hypothetical protein